MRQPPPIAAHKLYYAYKQLCSVQPQEPPPPPTRVARHFTFTYICLETGTESANPMKKHLSGVF